MTLPVFETPRLILRSIAEHDAAGLHEAYGDADAMRHWDLPPSGNVSQTAERIRLAAEADPRWHGMWSIQTHRAGLRAQSTTTPTTSITDDLRSGGSRCHRSGAQGIMTEAVPPVISHCFTHLNAHRIEARIEPENVSSRRLAVKLRFTEEGLLRDWLCVAGGYPQRRDVQPAARGVELKEENMLIVDAQIHLWNAGNPTSPWHRQVPAYLKDDALEGNGRGRGRCRGAHSAHAVGSERERALHRSGPPAPREVRDPRQLPARQAGESRARGYVEATPRDARPAVHVQ